MKKALVLVFVLILSIACIDRSGAPSAEMIKQSSKCYSGEKTGIFVLSKEDEKMLIKIVVKTPNPCYSPHKYIRENTVFIDLKRKPNICIQCIGVQEMILEVSNVNKIIVSVEGKEVLKYGK